MPWTDAALIQRPQTESVENGRPQHHFGAGDCALSPASYSSSEISFTSEDCRVTMLPVFSSLIFTAPALPALLPDNGWSTRRP